MAEKGCYTADCFFTGTAAHSNAAEGPCTRQAGYLANAEIRNIIKDPSRVNKNYVDKKSNTNILVYDDTQWVGWMSHETKVSRQAAYKSLNLGGTTNWASDLETYHKPPANAADWPTFLYSVKSGINPYQGGGKGVGHGGGTGNWTDVPCTAHAVQDVRTLSPSQRWNMMDCPGAWKDAIRVWETVDRGKTGLKFSQSVMTTINGPEMVDCGSLSIPDNCGQTLQCNGFYTTDSGAGGYEIWNSFVIIHEVRLQAAPSV